MNHTIASETDFLLCVRQWRYRESYFVVLSGQELPPMEFVVRSKSVQFVDVMVMSVGYHVLSNEGRGRKTIQS